MTNDHVVAGERVVSITQFRKREMNWLKIILTMYELLQPVEILTLLCLRSKGRVKTRLFPVFLWGIQVNSDRGNAFLQSEAR